MFKPHASEIEPTPSPLDISKNHIFFVWYTLNFYFYRTFQQVAQKFFGVPDQEIELSHRNVLLHNSAYVDHIVSSFHYKLRDENVVPCSIDEFSDKDIPYGLLMSLVHGVGLQQVGCIPCVPWFADTDIMRIICFVSALVRYCVGLNLWG